MINEATKNKNKWNDPLFWQSLADEHGYSKHSIRWLMIYFGIGVPLVIMNKMKEHGIKLKATSSSSVGMTYSQMIELTEGRKIDNKVKYKKTAIDVFNERVRQQRKQRALMEGGK